MPPSQLEVEEYVEAVNKFASFLASLQVHSTRNEMLFAARATDGLVRFAALRNSSASMPVGTAPAWVRDFESFDRCFEAHTSVTDSLDKLVAKVVSMRTELIESIGGSGAEQESARLPARERTQLSLKYVATYFFVVIKAFVDTHFGEGARR